MQGEYITAATYQQNQMMICMKNTHLYICTCHTTHRYAKSCRSMKHIKLSKGKKNTLIVQLSGFVDFSLSLHMMVRDNRFTQTHTQKHSEEIPSWVESSNIRRTHSHFIRTAAGLSQRELSWHTHTHTSHKSSWKCTKIHTITQMHSQWLHSCTPSNPWRCLWCFFTNPTYQ